MSSDLGDRGQWSRQVEFILACVGYAVGLGNIWRFPYLAYSNGGGAFLIPYAVALVIAGLPIFYMELALGQFSSLGPVSIFGKLVPLFQGLGWSMCTVSFLVCIYYNVIICWIVLYLVFSFNSPLLWSGCANWWNTAACFSDREVKRCVDEIGKGAFFFNRTCFAANATAAMERMDQYFGSGVAKLAPAEEFFDNYVLNRSAGFHEMGELQLKLVLALFVAWTVIFFCLIKGVKSTGKVVYVTATLPYVVLIILLIRGVTLPGASDGIKYYITPKVDKIWDIKVWRSAATQIFYSLGPGFGSLLTMASYNKFSNNCFRDAVIVALVNCCTSVLGGFCIFSTMGFMARQLGTDVSNVVKSGTGLAFIAYPEAIVRMPGSPFWAVLFFVMLFTLGLDSQFAMVEAVTTGWADAFPAWRKQKKEWVLVLIVCIVMFVLGLPMCMRGGVYVLTLFDYYSAGYCLVVIALLEFVVVIYIYGLGRITADIEVMLGANRSGVALLIGPTGLYWKVMWSVGAPLLMGIILLLTFVFIGPTSYGDYVYPPVAEAFGWMLSSISLLWLPGFALYHLLNAFLYGLPLSTLFEAQKEWCPAHEREKLAQVGGGSHTVHPAVDGAHQLPLCDVVQPKDGENGVDTDGYRM